MHPKFEIGGDMTQKQDFVTPRKDAHTVNVTLSTPQQLASSKLT